MKSEDDKTIVDLFLARDESAIEMTREKYGMRLRWLAYGITADQGAAEECENDTYLESWNSIPPHEPREYFYPFLARITRHLSLNFCRKNNALKRSAFISELTREMEECIPDPSPEECLMGDETFGEVLNDFLKSLTAEKRCIFIRRYWFLEPVREIANRYAISESKVKTTLFRCRKELRDYLEKGGYKL